MGTSMASVSFRRTDNVNWAGIKPKIVAMYQDIEGLVDNLEQEQDAYAIVSPYGDMGMFLADMPQAISQLTGDYAIFCGCMDSDFALLELYQNGLQIDQCAIGMTEILEEIGEMMDVKGPNLAKWKPLLRNPQDEPLLQAAFTADALFVEDQLRKISTLLGIPIFADSLVYGQNL